MANFFENPVRLAFGMFPLSPAHEILQTCEQHYFKILREKLEARALVFRLLRLLEQGFWACAQRRRLGMKQSFRTRVFALLCLLVYDLPPQSIGVDILRLFGRWRGLVLGARFGNFCLCFSDVRVELSSSNLAHVILVLFMISLLN